LTFVWPDLTLELERVFELPLSFLLGFSAEKEKQESVVNLNRLNILGVDGIQFRYKGVDQSTKQ